MPYVAKRGENLIVTNLLEKTRIFDKKINYCYAD